MIGSLGVVINESNNSGLVNLSQYPINYPGQPITLTFDNVLNTFSHTFVFRMELLAIAFFGIMLYLQYYTKQLEKAHRQNIKWSEYIEQALNIKPILTSNLELSNKDKYLILISDIMFLPSVAFMLIFIGYETGWFI